MTELNFIANVKLSEDLVETARMWCDKSDHYLGIPAIEAIVERGIFGPVEDVSEEYIGLISMLLIEPEMLDTSKSLEISVSELARVFCIPYRAFVRGMSINEDNELVLYYSASHSAEVKLWKEVVRLSKYVLEVCVRVDSDYPEDEEEMGANWSVDIKGDGCEYNTTM